MPRWASLNEASDYSRVPWRTLRRWISDGILPAYRIGPRQLQVDLNDIDRLRRRIPSASDGTGPGRGGERHASRRDDMR